MMKTKTTIALGMLCLFATIGMGCNKNVPVKTGNAGSKPNPQKKTFAFDEAALLQQNYTKIFEDDFSSIDNAKWEVWNGGAYNKELQLYRGQNLSSENGSLVIQSTREEATGPALPGSEETKTFNFTSGRIDSRFTFAASDESPKIRVVARIQSPKGTGMWPAFWTNGDNWPTKGEIDILEALGDPFSYQTDYFYGTTPGKLITDDSKTMTTITSASDLTNQFHIYEVIWEKNSLTYLLDGAVVDVKHSSDPGGEYIPAFFGKLHHVTLNLAVGGQMFGDDLDPASIQPSAMYVDWIKIYSGQ